jgi:hypothetical protein
MYNPNSHEPPELKIQHKRANIAHCLSLHPPIENVLEYDDYQKHAEVHENTSRHQCLLDAYHLQG